jgi:uncharacterized protein YecE (DUF72 family)
MKVYIGTSGWNYKHWKGLFYPEEIPESKWLEYYSRFFNTVEINMTFYRFPDEKSVEKWEKMVPAGFLFSVKGNRIITHVKKLKDIENLLKRFLTIISLFGRKLGPVLFQLPPSFAFKKERLNEFCKVLSSQNIIEKGKFSIEMREKSWLNEETFSILKFYGISLCFSDYPELEVSSPLTSSFAYIRRHGPSSLYSSCYTEKEIEEDSRFILELIREKKDVFIYYNNDAYAWAVKNALQLKEKIEKCL